METSYRPFRPPPLPARALPDIEKGLEWYEKDERPLFIEIGCGVGFHPIFWGKSNPQKRLLAFERTSEKFNKAHRRWLNNGRPENVLILHGDATVLLPTLLPRHAQVDGFYFLYPNPYPKSSQANLRWAFSPFLTYIREVTKPSGELVFATNETFYAHELAEHLVQRGFILKSFERLLHDTQPRTHFEKKYLARGETCFNLCFTPDT